jgi:hypothetical protein
MTEPHDTVLMYLENQLNLGASHNVGIPYDRQSSVRNVIQLLGPAAG